MKYISYEQNMFFDRYLFRIQDHIRVILKKYLFMKLLRIRDKQSCEHCGRDQKIVWSVKDDIWNKLPKKYLDKCLCIECFVELCPIMLSNDDFLSISFVDPFRDIYIETKPKPKKKRLRSYNSLQELIDNEPPNLVNGMEVYIKGERATFVLSDGEWENKKHLNEDNSNDDYLG